SPKLVGDDFPAITQTNRRSPLCVVSITLPRSPVSLSSGDEVPHIFTRKSRLQPGEFLISSAKRLLQHYLPKDTERIAATEYRYLARRDPLTLGRFDPAQAVNRRAFGVGRKW